jgi:head-tail adaptor
VSVASLLTERATLHAYTSGGDDDYGNPTLTWSTVGTVQARFEQRTSEERTRDRSTLVSDWVLFLLPATVVDGRMRVSDEYGRLFEVVGTPAMRRTPSRDMMVEVSLRHVDGG